MIILYILIGFVVAGRAIYMETQSLDYYQREKWYHYTLTFIFNFLLWPITIVMMIVMKRYTVELDRKFLKKRYPNHYDENGNLTCKR